MYKIYITGYGAEMTQGTLPIDTVLEIKESLETHDIELSQYIIDSTFADDHFDWFEIDDHFHCFGAYLDDSKITVEDESGNEIYSEACSHLTISNGEWSEELYPEDSKVGAVGVLTCSEVQKGTFTIGTLNAESFDPSLLSINTKGIGDSEFVTSILYDGVELEGLDFGDSISKNFIAHLEE